MLQQTVCLLTVQNFKLVICFAIVFYLTVVEDYKHR